MLISCQEPQLDHKDPKVQAVAGTSGDGTRQRRRLLDLVDDRAARVILSL